MENLTPIKDNLKKPRYEDQTTAEQRPVTGTKDERVPNISVSLALDPTTHSYSSSHHAPRLRLTLTSYADRPVTIYNDSLNLGRILAEGKFSILDVTRNDAEEVPQIKARFCDFEPPTKVQVPLRESLFYTLYPEEPLVFEAAFGPSNRVPKPRHQDPDDSAFPEAGRSSRGGQVRGVDGLEPGHHYRLRACRDDKASWGYIRWWEYGEREEVMNPPGGGRLDGREVAYHHRKSPHRGIRLDVKSIPDIDFWCTE